MLRDTLAADGLFNLTPAPLAERATLLRVHGAAYVDAFLGGTLDERAMRRIGFPWSAQLVRRTLASVGGTLHATRQALTTGFGGTLAGGTHHAFHDEGAGFCVFNDLAVAIEEARAVYGVKRAAVVDLDVHQGDGTAVIFAGDEHVFTLSLHGERNFPFRKQASRLDVELGDRTNDEEYLTALARALEAVWAFEPELVLYQAGVDGLATDRLGRLALTPAGIRRRDQMVMGAAKERGLPLVVTLGGGYSEPIELTVAAHAATFRCLWDVGGGVTKLSGGWFPIHLYKN